MQEISKIHFSRSGGFAGFNLNLTLNVHELPESEINKLKKLINEACISNKYSKKPKGADLFSYSIVFESAQGSESFHINQQEVTPVAEPLINYLSDLAKKKR